MSAVADLPLAITCGDPAGVGPEIAAAWAAEHPAFAARCAFIGPREWCDGLPGLGVPVGEAGVLRPGEPGDAGARTALAAMEEAAAGCLAGRYSAVVTGPVSKERLARIGYPFPGQTEFFAARWGGEPTMGFVGERLKVVLATWHIPLMSVARALTPHALELAVGRAALLAAAHGAPQPRIAVCGLNPHAGEAGILGSEEQEHIDPCLDTLRGGYPGLSRCLPADTVFHRALRDEFDVVVALYHDQGLAPLKTLEFDSAVNVTLGLPHVRSSPDHGTAFGIAGQGKASARSFANAVQVAIRLKTRLNSKC